MSSRLLCPRVQSFQLSYFCGLVKIKSLVTKTDSLFKMAIWEWRKLFTNVFQCMILHKQIKWIFNSVCLAVSMTICTTKDVQSSYNLKNSYLIHEWLCQELRLPQTNKRRLVCVLTGRLPEDVLSIQISHIKHIGPAFSDAKSNYFPPRQIVHFNFSSQFWSIFKSCRG